MACALMACAPKLLVHSDRGSVVRTTRITADVHMLRIMLTEGVAGLSAYVPVGPEARLRPRTTRIMLGLGVTPASPPGGPLIGHCAEPPATVCGSAKTDLLA